MIIIGKIIVLTVSDVEMGIYDKILDVINHSIVSDVKEVSFSTTDILKVGELIIDLTQHSVYKGTNEISLTNIEFQILYFLALHKGMVMSKEQIYEYVWNGEYVFDDSNITSHIRRLRVKIEDDPANPKYIETVRGIGYKMIKVDNVDR